MTALIESATSHHPSVSSTADVRRHHIAGEATARACVASADRRTAAAHQRRRTRALKRLLVSGVEAHPAVRSHRVWLAENGRLIASTVNDVQHFAGSLHGLPLVRTASGAEPRACALASGYLDTANAIVDETGLVAFLAGAQEVDDLTMAEVWALRPALQLLVAERLFTAVRDGAGTIPTLINSLRTLAEMRWKDLFAAVNVVDPILAGDPAGVFASMDDESRDQYRRSVSELAEFSGLRERDVAEAAIALAAAAPAAGDARATVRRRHVGYYLVDAGVPLLRIRIGYRAPLRQRLIDSVRAHATVSYLAAVTVATLVMLVPVALLPGHAVYALIGCVLLLLPATQAAVDVVNTLFTTLLPPRQLPKLDFEAGVPDECLTLVATPALLIDERHVRRLVMDMEIRYLANRDRNVRFALVTNSADAREQPDERHTALHLCQALVRELNARHGSDSHTPFHLLHRFRAYNPSERRWIGWERKRGKLLDLNQLLRGVRDRFPVKVGNVDALRATQFVIVLDSDTQLPRDAARRMIGAMAHPLNRAVVDPQTRMVVEGYGILQPRISVSTGSAVRSWLANLYAGESGFDIYTRAVSDVYQDLFGEGSFTGKGIYDVDVFRASLENRFPANTLLSHDLIEGLFARAGLLTDVELVDDYPSHFSAYCRRRHRWMRGDWQILRWLRNIVPDYRRHAVANPLGAIARWKILDNLRRTVIEVSTLALLVAAWTALPAPEAWTLMVMGLWLLPTYARLLLAIVQAPRTLAAARAWLRTTLVAFLRAHVVVALQFAFLLHDALLSLDAIGRSLIRMFVTRQRLLEWETAAEAAMRTRGATDVYLDWSPIAAAALALLLAWRRPDAAWAAGPVLAAWMSAGPIARWLNRRPRAAVRDLPDADVRFLRQQALRTWGFFAAYSGRANHWLIPDSVLEDGTCDERLSPTNLAMLLNARIAAVRLGHLTRPEFVAATRRTLATMARLPRYRGHFLNWYDNRTLLPLEPRFVSTVDSGNLAAALWALKQAALGFAREEADDRVLWSGIMDVVTMLREQDDVAALTVAERVMRSEPGWRAALPQLEEVVRHVAASAQSGEMRRWASVLSLRLRKARCAGGHAAFVAHGLRQIASEADRLVKEMDFAFLYDAPRKVLSVGCNTASHRCDRGTYDLLASESRTAAFVAVAKGDVPQESWLHLGRTLAPTDRGRVLVSWTGTLFEYLMPALWFRQRPRTIMADSMQAAVEAQRRYARTRDIPWGFSESAFIVPGDSAYGYGPVGLPDLALKPIGEPTVVAPYASFLALLVDPAAAVANLRRLVRLGSVGRFGMFEAIDVSRREPALVRCWMSHHQGMSLVSMAELLAGRRLQRDFHAEPLVRATERILDERVPFTVVPAPAVTPRVLWPEESAA